jgi:hypothetical protein
MTTLTGWTSRLAVIALVALGLPALVPAHAAQAVVTVQVDPSRPIPGETFTITGKLRTKGVRPVRLERRSCKRVGHRTTCHWKKVTGAHTSTTGRFTLKATAGASSVTVRVVAKAVTIRGAHYRRVTTSVRTIRPVTQQASLSIPTTVVAGQPQIAQLSFTPARPNRPTQVQAFLNGQWTSVGEGTQSSKGTAAVAITLAAGQYSVRAVTLAWHGAPAVASATTSITATPPVVGQATDLCAGIGVTGKAKVAYSSLAKPARGAAVTDPDFGTTIRRVTDVAAQWPGATVVVPAYPTIQAWNADESALLLYVTEPSQGWALFDGKTYAFRGMLDINPADVEQFYWSTTDPDLIYYVDQNSFVLTRMHVSTGAKDAVHDFAADIAHGPLKTACSGADLVSGGGDPFFTSYDNDLIGLGCRDTSGGATTYEGFGYRISTDTVGPTMHLTDVVAQAAPSGTARFLAGESSSTVLDATTNAVKGTLSWNGFEHSDLLRNAAGEDLVAGAQYDGPSGSGTLMVANLNTGRVSTIIGEATGDPYPPTGTLVSGKAFKNPGWVAVGSTGNGLNSTHPASTYLEQEILLANVDTNQVCRVAHHRSFGYDANSSNQNYWAQPNVVISPSGTRILFPSDWYGGATIDTYVIELPSYVP